MFDHWSPAELATVLGFRINLVGEIGHATAYLVGKNKSYSHANLCATLARLAKLKRIDPAVMPLKTPRALRDGQEQ